ncbi:hypothetical protein IU429_05900 [Nocardia elegans]|uniref:hypothetical protein n=1 Tax=Nocardia elegans TaxID=300029 RepID=UPI001893F302|nr:hypothetical protein [Nocardia elegans]MBF6447193.1 hypothetical protein [Nocardia elegans]
MIVVAYISTFNGNVREGLSVTYRPGHDSDEGYRQPAFVHIEVEDSSDHHVYLAMRVDEARQLVADLTNIVMQHDAAEHLASEKAA